MAEELFGVYTGSTKRLPGRAVVPILGGVASVSIDTYTRVGAVELPTYDSNATYTLHYITETTDVTNAAMAYLYDLTGASYVAGSDSTNSSTTPTSYALAVTLVAAHIYELHLKQAAADPAEAAVCSSAWIEVTNP